MFIGVISDTHGVFSDPFKEFLAPVDELWHAGDFGGDLSFVHGISAFKPLVGVYGNCDAQEIRFECPLVQLFNCEGKKVLMTRVATPAGARAIGSDYIVVGRPITQAADPAAAYVRCVAEFVDEGEI